MTREGMDKRILKALSNEHRVRALRALVEEGPKTYSDLMVHLGFDPERDRGKFTYHLNLLREAGLIQQQDGFYRLSKSGLTVMEILEASEPRVGHRPSFWAYFRGLSRVHRLIVALLFIGVGLYLSAATLAFWDWADGNQIAFLVGLVALILGLVSFSLILTSLPGGQALRWERAVLFALVAGIYGVFIGLAVEPPVPVLGLIPAVVLSLLGYRTLGRGPNEIRGMARAPPA